MGSARSVNNSTDTGAGTSVSVDGIQFVTAQVVASATGSTGAFKVEGSLDGANWTDIIGSSTFTDSRVVSSTMPHVFTVIRANLTATSTNPVTIFVAGK